MLSINNLLLNIFVNLFGILAFLSVDIKPRYQRTCIAVLACLTILLCMTFPFYTVGHAFFDLRVIPLILAILYGGPRVGLLCAAFLFGYRAFLGTGFGLTLSVLGMLPVILASLLSIKRFRRAQRLPRATIAAGLSLITFISLLVSSCLMRASNKDLLLFLISDCLLQLLTMWMTVYMVETLRENIRMRHEVQRMEKLHVLGELAASIAHEIRNPMTVTKGFVQLLNEHVPDHKKHYIHISIAELARAESIINDYLSYAKPQIELPEALAVEEEIEQIANVMSSYATLANVEIVQHISEPLTILADRKKLLQVLMNLTKNGIEAMPNGGTLHLRCYRQNEFACIEVIDTGVGMSQANLQRLGNPFYSTKEKGTGLGLMVSYRIVEAMNGKIRVSSQPEKGTRFTLLFPLYS